MKSILAMVYLLGLKIKEALYKLGVLKLKSLQCKVISVGNITAGGTGKTPVTEYVVKQLSKTGKAAILTRGYKRENKAELLDVKPESSPKECGDEAVLLARKTNVPVIAAVNRYKGGLYAIEKYGVQFCVLDDGFQRRHSLYRNLELLVIDASNPFGNGKLLPAGILREKMENLADADMIILTKTNDAVNMKELLAVIQKWNDHAKIAESIYEPYELYNIFDNNDKLPLSSVGGKKVLALSAIGNPKYFGKVISGLNPGSITWLSYPDHYSYSERDIKTINENSSLFDIVITTEKDAVKLELLDKTGLSKKIYALNVELKILKGEKELQDKMNLCGLTSGVSANGIQFIIHAAFIHGVTSVVFCGILAINNI
ncbi:MAG: tetraacyldisaccharide 4'-kinase [Candidatus Firestonebacteria bacterium RIFOXYC2_FULL_39_67]|nr:MAG: tetraacyldisaccharide 4'-kinase [Candidatus Firestonebacteria bacterium RIFOXYD2_FULL_39_29]OGF54758.1 MAG: tetraacyldisaccharide 4'-kinase [Candidatus Firestonebacteria bacterium RIFOXYC2_FULL_39_67]